MKIYLVVKKNRYAEIGRQFPLRMEWSKSVQVQILLPIILLPLYVLIKIAMPVLFMFNNIQYYCTI